MRASLFYNPLDVIERLALGSRRWRRRRRLRATPAAALGHGYLDGLELLEALRDHPPGVIYDIGANIGTWTCLAKSLFPQAQIEAFEPISTHAPAFARWTAAWPRDVRLHHVALGSQDTTAEMNLMSAPDASSLLSPTAETRQRDQFSQTGMETVRVARLDTLLEQKAVRPPDLIKLDVQGYELAVLQGGLRCLGHARAVISEISVRPAYVDQPALSTFLAFLEEHGFHLSALAATTPLGNPIVQTDALFLREPPFAPDRGRGLLDD